jgi:hypothetical protein
MVHRFLDMRSFEYLSLKGLIGTCVLKVQWVNLTLNFKGEVLLMKR